MWKVLSVSTFVVAGCGGGRPHETQLSNTELRLTVELVARFQDATGLPVGTRIMVAGLELGRVSRLEPDGSATLVWLELRDDLELWSNAVLTKKASSLLGDLYLELDPGTDTHTAPDGSRRRAARLGPRCPGYASGTREDALRCREVTGVVEKMTSEEILKRIDSTLPPLP